MSGIITVAVSMTMINEQQKRRGQAVICKLETCAWTEAILKISVVAEVNCRLMMVTTRLV